MGSILLRTIEINSASTEADLGLASPELDRFDWMALRDLSKSYNDLEPIEARAKTGVVMAERLVHLGLIETGPCSAAYAEQGFRTGYRLTLLGWLILERVGLVSRYKPVPSSHLKKGGYLRRS